MGRLSSLDPGHPDPWPRWRVPRGCPMLAAGHPPAGLGRSQPSHGRGACGCVGAQSCHGGRICGVMEPPLRNQSVLEAGERALRCCQGLDEQGRALGAFPGGTGGTLGAVQGLQSQFLCQSHVTEDTFKVPFYRGLLEISELFFSQYLGLASV